MHKARTFQYKNSKAATDDNFIFRFDVSLQHA